MDSKVLAQSVRRHLVLVPGETRDNPGHSGTKWDGERQKRLGFSAAALKRGALGGRDGGDS